MAHTLSPITGEEIRRIRKRLKLTQVEFAAIVQVHANYLARLERGEAECRPAAAALIRLAGKYGPEAVAAAARPRRRKATTKGRT